MFPDARIHDEESQADFLARQLEGTAVLFLLPMVRKVA